MFGYFKFSSVWEVGMGNAAPGTIYRITNTAAIGHPKWFVTFGDLAGASGFMGSGLSGSWRRMHLPLTAWLERDWLRETF